MATTADSSNGVIYDRLDLTLLDTRAMAWEEFPGLKGCKVKTLSRFPDGHAQVFLGWLPPGSPIPIEQLPHWEYESAEQQHGDLVISKEGFYMHRRPGSLHGLEPGPESDTGCLSLFWRDVPYPA